MTTPAKSSKTKPRKKQTRTSKSTEKVSFAYIGPPKTASTWIYACLYDHPEICAPQRDELYYFDQYHALGEQWYHERFPKDKKGIRIDCTPTTICERGALERLITYNPDIKIALSLRNPVERAFSAYWHVKKRGQITWDFSDILKSYSAYLMWLAPGLFAHDLAYLISVLPRENLHVFLFDDLKKNPNITMENLYDFIGIDNTHKPAALTKRVNHSGAKTTFPYKQMNKALKMALPQSIYDNNFIQDYVLGKKEYRDGIKQDLRTKLMELCREDIQHYEELLGIDLSHWTQ